MTINTKNEKLSDAYSYYVTEIQPKLAPFEDKLNRKLNASEYIKELESDSAFFILFRSIKKALDLYRKENIQLISEISEESKKFGSLSAAQTISHEFSNRLCNIHIGHKKSRFPDSKFIYSLL